MKTQNVLSILVLGFLIFGTFASAADLSTTTMTWYVPTIKSITVAYGSPCSSSAFFFLETNAGYDNDSDANWARAVPHSNRAGDSNCQTSTQAAITITNNGNTTINIDGNFTTGMTGSDVNLELKVWQGTGSGCGTNGMGGWQEPCSVSGITSAPTSTTCKEFSSGSTIDTEGTRLVTSLPALDTNQLCFSGDLNGSTGYGASSGDHNKTFQIGILFS